MTRARFDLALFQESTCLLYDAVGCNLSCNIAISTKFYILVYTRYTAVLNNMNIEIVAS